MTELEKSILACLKSGKMMHVVDISRDVGEARVFCYIYLLRLRAQGLVTSDNDSFTITAEGEGVAT